MKMRTSLIVAMLALGLTACGRTTFESSGGSGLLESEADSNSNSYLYSYPSPYSRPYYSAYAARWATSDCAPVDVNCTIIYNGPGGGD